MPRVQLYYSVTREFMHKLKRLRVAWGLANNKQALLRAVDHCYREWFGVNK